ncbi:MAG: hypothetical protein ACXVMS_05870 [Flavisolibacter sp.]
MSDFTLSLTVDGMYYHFFFTRINTPRMEKYFVTAENQFSKPESFEMRKDFLGRWKVMLPAPAWISDCESRISEMMNETIGQAF